MKDRATLVAILLLAGAILFNLVALWPEVALEAPVLNDDTLHLDLVERTVEALDRGEDPTDFWVPDFVQGYPLFHHYQHLPHLVTALLYKGLGGALSLRTLYDLVRYLLLCTFPLSVYWAGRRLGLRAPAAALAGLLSSLLSSGGLYGMDFSSYVWRGWGMYTQLWGMWLLPPALAGLYVTIREGRAWAGTAALVAATLLSHTVLGYVALLSGVLFLLLGPFSALGRRALRLGLVLLLVALLSAYFLLPFFLDRLYMNRSVWEDPGKYDAYGWQWTLQALFSGRLLDSDRFPSLTLLAGLGLVVSIFRWRRSDLYRLLVLFFLFWLALYFGRPTWGVLLNLLPMSSELHLHRFIVPVHLGALGLAGLGLAWLWERAWAAFRAPPPWAGKLGGRLRFWPLALAGILSAGLLGPVYAERSAYLALNGRWLAENLAAYRDEEAVLDGLLEKLRGLPPGRVYAGRAAGWGNDYRVGSVPLYAFLAQNGLPNPGYLYHALSLNADIEGYLDEGRPATFNLFNLRYIVAPADRPGPAWARPLVSYGRHTLYLVETGGYFDLVDSRLLLYGPRADWFAAAQAWVQSRWVEARQHPRIVFGPAPVGEAPVLPLSAFPQQLPDLPLPTSEPCGRILREEVQGGTYTVEFTAGRACWLLLKATFHPGWEATLDGRKAETAMLAPSFVGVAVEPGGHRAVFRYRPWPLRLPLGVAGLAVFLLAALAEWQGRRLHRLVGHLRVRRGERRTPRWPVWETWGEALRLRWQQEWRWVALLLVFVLLTGLPTLQMKQMTGHDALEYLPRAVEFYRGLQEGEILPRWAPDLSRGYGQPFFLFNPPLVYYLASAFHALGASFIASLNLTCLVLLALAGLGMYLFAREFFGQAGGVVAGVGYVLAPYTLTNLYVRYALADLAAMCLLPWAFWGLWRWAWGREDGPASRKEGEIGYLLGAAGATALLPLSSNPVALVVIPVLGVYVLFLARRKRRWRVLGRGLLALALGLALSAFFWLPAIAERHWVKLDNLLRGYLNYQNHFVYLHQLIYSPWGFGLSLPGPYDEMSFGLGLVPLVMLGVSLVLARYLRAQLREAGEGWPHFWFFIGVLGLAVFLVTDNSLWLWNRLPLLPYLEFPWRALVLAALATAFICAFPFLGVREEKRRRRLLLVLLGGFFLAALPYAHPEGFHEVSDADYAPAVIAARGIEVTTTGEYEPVWAMVPPESPAPASRLFVLAGRVRLLEQSLTGTSCRWLLEADGPAWLRAAVFYYPGWQLVVDGRVQSPSVQNPYGLMDFGLSGGLHRVELTFRMTALRQWALAISGAALLVTVGWPVWQAWRRSRA
ncbi:MAG: 6-pyruvoyl-tetrahydropterin synthase-related protein [Chloroflexia bacterium]